MTLAQLGALILRLLGVTQTVEGLVNGLTLAFNGWKTQWDTLVTPITGTYAIVNDIAHGNVAIKAAIDSMTGSGTYDLNAILAAIAALPAGSDIVIPPSGDNAEAVWDYTRLGALNTMGTHMIWAGSLSKNFGAFAAPRMNYNPLFTVEGSFWDESISVHQANTPAPDWGDIQPADTRLSWLQRTDTLNDWNADAVTGDPWAPGDASAMGQNWTMRPTFTEAQFQAWKATLATLTAPVWPGIADVTPGAPVALTDGLVLAGPMHGVLLDLTVLPSGGTAWLLGATRIPYNWGQVGFMSDNGEMEAFQWLSAEHSVYLPRQLAVAASASFRVTRPCTATVTPFTIP